MNTPRSKCCKAIIETAGEIEIFLGVPKFYCSRCGKECYTKENSSHPPQNPQECKCACHEDKLNKPYAHDTSCCKEMNGDVEKPQEPIHMGMGDTMEIIGKPRLLRLQDWGYLFKEEFGIHFKDSKGELQFAIEFIEELLVKARAEAIKEVENLIVEEMFICQKEGQPTSRLTSLAVKLGKLLEGEEKQPLKENQPK